MGRRLLSKSEILDAVMAGKTELELAPDMVVTPLARDLAKDRGLTLVPHGCAASKRNDASQGCCNKDHAEAESDENAVKASVLAALGYEPKGLDDIIRRVMN